MGTRRRKREDYLPNIMSRHDFSAVARAADMGSEIECIGLEEFQPDAAGVAEKLAILVERFGLESLAQTEQLHQVLVKQRQYIDALERYCPPTALNEINKAINEYIFFVRAAQADEAFDEYYGHSEAASEALKYATEASNHLCKARQALAGKTTGRWQKELQMTKLISEELLLLETYLKAGVENHSFGIIHEENLVKTLAVLYRNHSWKVSEARGSKFMNLCIAVFQSLGSKKSPETIRRIVKKVKSGLEDQLRKGFSSNS